jgi:hypothetical protein
MSTPEARPDPLAELAAAEAADNDTVEQPTQQDDPEAQPDLEAEPQQDQSEPWRQAGFRDPEAVWNSYQNMQQKFRERDEEIGELRRFQREVSQQMQQAQQPQHQQQQATLSDGTPYYELETLQSWVDSGDMTEFTASAIWADQQAKLHAEQMVSQVVQQRLAPLEQARIHQGAQQTLDELNVALGDDVIHRHQDLISQLITQDREHYAHPQHGSRRLIEAVKSAEWDYQTGTGSQQPRDPNGRFAPADTYVEGGSSAQPHVKAGGTRLDADEQELISSLVPQRVVDEAGVPIPWAR